MTEWVATETFESAGMFYEAGGIYDHEPRRSWGVCARSLQADEHVATCPRCGQRFATTEDGTAESHRDLHFDGDDDIPSICRYPKAPRPTLIVGGKAEGSRTPSPTLLLARE